jgi:hypothetical protein
MATHLCAFIVAIMATRINLRRHHRNAPRRRAPPRGILGSALPKMHAKWRNGDAAAGVHRHQPSRRT